MAWSVISLVSTGELATASVQNTQVLGNLNELRTGGVAIASQAANDLIYASSATQLARLATGTGVVVASGGVPSYTATPSLDQVVFPAAQVPSAGANTLDDYEENTWTPVIGGSGGTSGQTYAYQVGWYVKVGKLVTVGGYVELSAKGTITTNVQIQGLPFTIENVSNARAVGSLEWISLGTTWVSIVAELIPNTTVATLRGTTVAAASNSAPLSTADIQNGTAFAFTFAYRASA